ncbi:DUF1566 domain-containing protein [Wenzhouxiangella sp. AB-CW3]|uniref:Lcl domain-containing protein n=1 Tax=Wenzhouxiangella sp. AB-CW3 TaxID=2771012 RepID=UPI00168AD377|nr:DUF1566 domain-containing protein [Wenzhouxiangella sp. AB-CW3]QOC22357.1 DUF1566 domain-containing protein [Wenzhouxiangella sp. AB-CW3]
MTFSIPRNLVVAALFTLPMSALLAASDPDETVTFNGLKWALQTNGNDITWPDAIDYCEQLDLAGHGDWRLPSMEELQSLHDPDAADGRGIRDPIHIDTCCLWSNESLEDRPAEDGDETAGPPDRYHWGFMFDGGLEYYAVHIFDDGQALCVRDPD